MTTHDYEYLLNTADKPESQIKFCEEMAIKWRQNGDNKMSTMYVLISQSLKEKELKSA